MKRKTDSRLLRSKTRPGRATAWEIKMALGYPATAQLPAGRFTGTVTANGDVAVYDKKKDKSVTTITCQELDQLETNQRINRTGMKVGVNYTSGGALPINVSTFQNVGYNNTPIQNNSVAAPNVQSGIVRNAAQLNAVILDVARISSMVMGIVALINRIQQTYKASKAPSDTVNGAKAASEKIKEVATKLNQSTGLLNQLRKMNEKLQGGSGNSFRK